MPSRGRPDSLAESVASLLALAKDPASVEVLVAADPDDPGTADAARSLDGVRLWTAPERYGYMRLHRYYNRLAAMAEGEWLLGTWNDDARMLTPGWDEIIEAQQPGVLWSATRGMHGGNFWPCWPRAWSDAWGHVALCANVDVWVSEVGGRLGRQWQIPVEILHDRFDVTGGHDDQTYAEGRKVMGAYANHPDYDSPANREARIRDSLTARRLMEGRP